jgi:hypothetical protein
MAIMPESSLLHIPTLRYTADVSGETAENEVFALKAVPIPALDGTDSRAALLAATNF